AGTDHPPICPNAAGILRRTRQLTCNTANKGRAWLDIYHLFKCEGKLPAITKVVKIVEFAVWIQVELPNCCFGFELSGFLRSKVFLFHLHAESASYMRWRRHLLSGGSEKFSKASRRMSRFTCVAALIRR